MIVADSNLIAYLFQRIGTKWREMYAKSERGECDHED